MNSKVNIDEIEKYPFNDIYISLSDNCNLKCIYCFNKEDRKIRLKSGKKINNDEIIDILKQFRELNGTGVVFTGGEPTLNKNLLPLCKEAKKIGLNAHFITNGTLLDTLDLDNLSQFVDSFAISLDSIEQNEINVLWNTTNVNINNDLLDKLVKINDFSRKKKMLDITIMPIVSKVNINSMDKLVQSVHKILKDCNISWKMTQYSPIGNEEVDKKLSISKMDYYNAVVNCMQKLNYEYFHSTSSNSDKEKLNNQIKSFALNEGGKLTPPKKPKLLTCAPSFFIANNGDIFPCQGFEKKGYKAGNYFEGTLKEFFDSVAFSNVRKRIIVNNKESCYNCELRFVCTNKCGGCITSCSINKDICKELTIIEKFYELWSGVLIMFIPTDKLIEHKYSSNMIKNLFNILKKQKGLFIKIFIFSVLTTLLGIIGTVYYQVIIDNIVPNKKYSLLTYISLLMIVLAIFKVITEFFRDFLMIYLSQNIDLDILLGYFNHVIRLPINFFKSRKVGEILSRFNDGSKIREAISSATVTLLIDSIMAVVGGFVLYRENGMLFKYCFIPIIIYLLLVSIFKNGIHESNKNLMRKNSNLNTYLIESLEGIETVKAFNIEKKINNKISDRFSKYMKENLKYCKLTNIQNSLKSITKSIFAIFVLWFGAYLVINQKCSIGSLITFNALTVYFIDPIERIMNLQPKIQSAIVASKRINEILELEVEKMKDNTECKSQSLLGDIVFENIDFRYGLKELTLNNINLKIREKEKIALVGESGSGKTTIAKMLLNFYKPDKSDITINSYNILDIDKSVLRKKIAYISQKSFFFSGTIYDNLKLANENATYEAITKVCKEAHIDKFIDSLPNKYYTILEENASNLDLLTEKAIIETLNECTSGITTIIIAHRLSTIRKCDKIFVLEKGCIVEEGAHSELINKRGYYQKLWESQLINTK